MVQFSPVHTTEAEEELRAEVRDLLARELPRGTYRRGLGMSGLRSREFSTKMAEAGLVGMAIPTEFGGQARTAVERFVVAEELFAAGAPVSGHWVGDRQTAPLLLSVGTEEQKQRFIPAIVRGDAWFSIGMSEPDAGSDLASVRMAATAVDGGWSVSGTKIWTSGAAETDHFVALVRTHPQGEDRHDGLSQLIVDLKSPGVTIIPITTLDGAKHFYEVVLDEVFVPDEMVLGTPGHGWKQVRNELGYERSGPERFLSPLPLMEGLAGRLAKDPDERAQRILGRLAARMWVIRSMSLSVARAIDVGGAPAVEASIVKDLGTTFEQEAVAAVQDALGLDPDPGSDDQFEALLAEAVLMSPSYTIRGGTTEVLRTVAARALLGQDRVATAVDPDDLLATTVEQVMEERCRPEDRAAVEGRGHMPELWDALVEGGFPWVGIPEEAGGSGGTLADAATLVRAAAAHGAQVPLAETALLGGWLLSRAGLALPEAALTVAGGHPDDAVSLRPEGGGWVLDAELHRVPFATQAGHVVLLAPAPDGDGHLVVAVPVEGCTVEGGRNLAGEPRDRVRATALALAPDLVAPAPADVDPEALALRGTMARLVAIAGALGAASDLTLRYSTERHQFGRPISAFQAVQHHMARMAAEAAAADMAARAAVDAVERGAGEWAVTAARVAVARSARIVTGAAHQVHGAIGMTLEYHLHHLTRPVWSWVQEFGSEADWALRAGRVATAAGPEGLWPLVTRGTV